MSESMMSCKARQFTWRDHGQERQVCQEFAFVLQCVEQRGSRDFRIFRKESKATHVVVTQFSLLASQMLFETKLCAIIRKEAMPK